MSRCWENLHEAMDTRLKFSSAYHPQTAGQTERVNQILEFMLRACALKDRKSWDKCLLYVEFSYNNNYQKSLKMSPFEVLYGRKYRTPLCSGVTIPKMNPLGKKRSTKGRVSRYLFQSIQISGVRFTLRGVGL
jgi:hypothetical protein